VDISQEVIRQIEAEVKKVLEQQSLVPSPPPSDRHILAIFDAAPVDLALPLQQIERCIDGGYIVTAILSELAAKLLDANSVRGVCGDERVFVCSEVTHLGPFEDFSLIAIPVLSYPMASKLALGMADTSCTYLIFQAMLRGNKVIAASDALEVASEARTSEISKLGRNYLKTLSSFGIQLVTCEHLAETILSDSSPHFAPVDSKGGKAVISASIIANLAPTVREFVYSNPAIITPLARDLAAQRGIRLVAKK
jgi:hypothetical protein